MKTVIFSIRQELTMKWQGMLRTIYSEMTVEGFSDLAKFERYMKESDCDVLFIDTVGVSEAVVKAVVNCVEKVNKVNNANNANKVNVVFLAESDQYMKLAFDIYASDYLIRPIGTDRIIQVFENLRYPKNVRRKKLLTIHCFGNFEVFSGEKPLEFRYNKTKELLAYLTDRGGALCSNKEIISVLWDDDDDHVSYFKSIRKDLFDTLKKHGCEEVICQQWGKIGLVTEVVNCDFYDWDSGETNKNHYKDNYKGEYMSQYSWAEQTNGRLQSAG